jgi:hypothetical protein
MFISINQVRKKLDILAFVWIQIRKFSRIQPFGLTAQPDLKVESGSGINHSGSKELAENI